MHYTGWPNCICIHRLRPALSTKSRAPAGGSGARRAPAKPVLAAADGVLDTAHGKSPIRKPGLTGHRTYEALSELVDNSIDARMSGTISVHVALDYAGQSMRVADDGAGMALSELKDAMTIAKEAAHPPGKGLGLSGLGMKTACTLLGGSFTIVTSKLGSSVEYVLDYDEDSWERKPAVRRRRFPYSERPKEDKGGHGTAITITKAKVPLYAEQTTKFKRRFGERYAAYLKQRQAKITINTIACKPVSPRLARNTTRRFRVDTPAGPIRAWAGLLQRRSVAGSCGISLHCKDRLIKAHTRFGIRGCPQTARVVGGISLDHVPVNLYKTGFVTESAEYKEAEDAFRAHPALMEVVQKSGLAPRQPADPSAIYGYLTGGTGDPPGISARPGRAESERLLDALTPFEFSAGGRRVAIRYGDAGGGLYTLSPRGAGLEVTINRNSPVFAAAKNPLYMVALAVAEAKMAAAGGKGLLPFLEERNREIARLVAGWARQDGKPPAAAAAAADEEPAEYRLSRSLDDLRRHLDVYYPFKFAFSGLSTLVHYTHNALATPFYSLYTEKGQGRHLAEMVVGCGDRYAPLLNPVGDDLDLFFDLTRSKSVVVIREYAPGEIAGPLAPPARAWADLFREVSRYRMPLMPEDLTATLEELRDRRLLGRRDLEAVLRRRGKRAGARHILDQVFAAQ